ncbi:MAG: LAGLIDADG family homing endonuclease, partial [Bacilli bacterium]
FINIKNDLDKVTKANISVKVTDDFMNAVLNDLDWELSFETKHETIKKTVNARKIFDMLCENNWNMAEPGLLFWDRIDKYNLISEDKSFEYGGVNPCFTGDMKLLTHEGYKTLEELCDTEPLIYSYDGLVSKGKVWCNGEKDTIKLTMSNNKEITCTPDHRFMTIDGEECEAKNLKNKKIMPKVYKTIKDDELFIKLGFIQGDGQLSRLDSEYHKGMEVNIGVRDGDIKYLFENDNYTIKSHRAIYLQGYNDLLEKLQFSHEVLPNRTMPKAYYEWDLNKKSNFLQGCFSANGCVNSNKRISYKTTCKEFAQELMDTLEKDFNITANLTVNKKHMVEFESGEYECRESYDVNINKYDDIVAFTQHINFYQNYKKIKLIKLIESRVPYVRNIKENGKKLVYDFKEPRNHWGIIEGFVAHNCAEEPLPIGGSCLLGSINLSEYVNDRKFDLQTFILDVHKIVRGMNDVLDQGLKLHPLEIQRETVRDWRQIGIGIMGIADMLIKMGIKYGSDESLSICDSIGFELANASILASSLIAKERGGVYPKYSEEAIIKSKFLYDNTTESTREVVKENGLANSQILTIAPCGSLSTMIGISGGIEPIFSLSYTRKTESLHEDGDVYYKVYTPIAEEYMKEHNLKEEEDLPNFFVTAQTLNPFKRVEMQSMWQNHIDASISSTVNLPNESTIEDVKELYIHAWKSGLKGMTIYRDGCARSGVLTLSDKDNKEEIKELKRGEWEDKPKGC